jgi:hypothetical protein
MPAAGEQEEGGGGGGQCREVVGRRHGGCVADEEDAWLPLRASRIYRERQV